MKLRHIADYEVEQMSAKVARRALASAKDFVETIEAKLGGDLCVRRDKFEQLSW